MGAGRSGAQSPPASAGSWVEALDRDHLDAGGERRLGPVLGRDDDRRRRPSSRAASAIARAPETRADRAVERQLADHRRRLRLPPTRAARRRSAAPPAIARSIPGPALRRLAGARLATIRRSGNSKPQLVSAARTRSRASRTAASGRPTTENAGRPRWTSTSTRTGRAEIPSRVNVWARGEHGADAREPRRAGGAQDAVSQHPSTHPPPVRVRSAPDRQRPDRAHSARHPRAATRLASTAMTETRRQDRAAPPRSSSPPGSPPPRWEIVERNARTRFGELDIVALDGATLVFIEVKAGRQGADFGPERPVHAIGPRKQRQVRRLATAWMAERRRDLPRYARDPLRRRRRHLRPPARPSASTD